MITADEVCFLIVTATSILLGERAPFEAQPPNRLVDPHGDTCSHTREQSHSPLELVTADSSDLGSSSSDEAAGSDQELPYRLSALKENIDALYSLAIKIRNPASRPMRSTKELYKHLPEHIRQNLISERESIEINVVKYILKQETLRLTDEQGLHYNEDTVLEFLAESNWLVSRIGCANARRKQQFAYWREHTDRMGAVERVSTNFSMRLKGLLDGRSSNTGVHLADRSRSFEGSQHLSLAHSGATSVTRLNSQVIKNFDTKSVLSHQSSASIVRGHNGEQLAWPSPPKLNGVENFFQCDFCREFCPRSYATEEAWP